MPEPAKGTMILCILEILRRYSDEKHLLSQKDIVEKLQTEYDMTVERKSIRRNILNLKECGYEIECSKAVRMTPNPRTGKREESSVCSDLYLVRDFTDSELWLLIDGLLCSRRIPRGQCRALVKKLAGLSSVYFRSRVEHVCTTPDTTTSSGDLFLTIEVVDEAISEGKQIKFQYASFGLDKKLHPRLNRDGSVKEYVVSPYQIAAANGRYYLICNTEPHDDVSHYRLDRVMGIQKIDAQARPQRTVRGLENGLDLPKHMAEHIYMFSGGSEPVTFRMKKHILNDVIDWFGTDLRFYDEGEDEVTARVEVNRRAMKLWAIQYGPYVTVTSPKKLAEEIKSSLITALEQYERTAD